jgi:glycosyltransferase involved in cell wall biosynthesis
VIRVGFVIDDAGSGWMGGANYIRNLIGVVAKYLSGQVQPVLLTATAESAKKWAGLKGVEVVLEPGVRTTSMRWRAGKALQRFLGSDPLFEAALRRHRIDVLSHSGHLGWRPGIPVISWIPDFQHVRMPEFFEPAEYQARNRRFHRLCDWSSRVIVSSEDARQDLERFSPSQAGKARVLRFVSGMAASSPVLPPRSVVEDKLGALPPFFHLPNQFWKHKNHLVAVRAAKLLADEGRKFCVVATGNPFDPKQPDYARTVADEVRSSGLEGVFLTPGLVPYELLVALMANAVSLINPSRFEGWSTSVEEAKTLGRSIILSDIPVHREQAPKRGIFFNTDSPEALAAAMRQRLDTFNFDEERASYADALVQVPGNLRQFAKTYGNIVGELVALKGVER